MKSSNQAATVAPEARLSRRFKALLFALVAIPASLLSVYVYAASTTPYTMAQVATHNTAADCWTVISGQVYNVTALVKTHTGGAGTITPNCGKDGTANYNGQHGGKANILTIMNSNYQIGVLSTATAPGAPTSVTATAGNLQAVITWAAPASNGGSPITLYTATSTPGGLTCTSTGALTCTVTGLTAGGTYTFTVTATNANGTSSPSVPSSSILILGTPSPPASVTATRGDSQITATWSAAAANGSTITGYTATATPGGKLCTTANAATLTCTITGLTNGTAYTVSVVALSGNGNSASSSPSNSVTPAGLPTAPTGVVGQRGDSSVLVSWAASSGNGDPVTNYTVTSTPGSKTCSSSGLLCTVTGLTNGTAYTFKVVATNGVGSSAASAASAAVTPIAGPGAPTNVTAVAANGQATVSWLAPASNGGSVISSYVVTSSPEAHTCQTSGALSCTVLGLTNGTAYTFTVTATNASSNSLPSAPSAAVTPAGPPSAPTEVTASAGDASAVISWLAPADNGSPITSYVVTASPGGLVCNSTTTVCTLSGLTNGVSYTFSVVAKNAVGSSTASVASNAITPRPDVLPVYSLTDISSHNTANNCWTAILGNVYDLNFGPWLNSLSPTGRAKALNNLCGRVGTAYWSANYSDFDPAVVLEAGHLATFDLSTITDRVRKAEVMYGTNTCWVAYAAAVYDLSMLVQQQTGDSLTAAKALCKTQPTLEAMVLAYEKLNIRFSDLNTYKIATYVEPFKIRLAEVEKHLLQTDCWTLIGGNVYDLTEYLQTQGNKAALTVSVCGKNATKYWGKKSITPIKRYVLGPLLGTASAPTTVKPKTWKLYTLREIKKHSTSSNCWTIVNGNVFRITSWLSGRSDKASLVQGLCGKTGSKTFNSRIKGNADKVWSAFKVGKQNKNAPSNDGSTGGGGGGTKGGSLEITWSMSDVKRHNKPSDCWTVVNGAVYSMTAYIKAHPGGAASIIGMCGIDATKAYMAVHANSPGAARDLKDTRIGKLG